MSTTVYQQTPHSRYEGMKSGSYAFASGTGFVFWALAIAVGAGALGYLVIGLLGA